MFLMLTHFRAVTTLAELVASPQCHWYHTPLLSAYNVINALTLKSLTQSQLGNITHIVYSAYRLYSICFILCAVWRHAQSIKGNMYDTQTYQVIGRGLADITQNKVVEDSSDDNLDGKVGKQNQVELDTAVAKLRNEDDDQPCNHKCRKGLIADKLHEEERHQESNGVHGRLKCAKHFRKEHFLLFGHLGHVAKSLVHVLLGLLQGRGDLPILLQNHLLVVEGSSLFYVHHPVILERLFQLLDGFTGRVREPSNDALGALLPEFALQKVADVAGVGEEMGVGMEGIVVHVFGTLLNRHGISAEVGLSARFLQVAVGKGDRQTALLNIGEQLACGVESRYCLFPARTVICILFNIF